MNLDENLMKKVLKEEYDKRIKYFLNEKISIKTKEGINVLEYAKGLKVLDNAGNQYTFDTIVKEDQKEYAKLYLPEEPREDAYGDYSNQSLIEYEENQNVEEIGFFSSRPKGGKRSIRPVLKSEKNLDQEAYSNDYLDSQQKRDKPKLPSRVYILVPMGEFEERFRLKINDN